MLSTNELRIYEVGECFLWEDEDDDPVRGYACTEANTNHGAVLLRLSTQAARELRVGLLRVLT
jgi:hypothetical protein